MAKRNFGLCKQCRRAPVVYQGAEFCSPKCNAEAYGKPPMRNVLSFDTETQRIARGMLAPPLVCLSVSAGEPDSRVWHANQAREPIVQMLKSDTILSAFNAAFDFAVVCAQWEDLIPLVFEVYRANRVSDTMLREQLRDIAEGTYKWGEDDEGDGTVRLNYNLEEVARRRCNIRLEKGGWQLRFGELAHLPVEQWPAEAIRYAQLDPYANHRAWVHQEAEDIQRGVSYFEDEFRQSRAAFWLHLMGCWGFHTSAADVREFARKTKQKYEQLRDELVVAGIVRKTVSKKRDGSLVVKFTKKKAPVQKLVYEEFAKKQKHPPLTKTAEKKLDLLEELIDREHVQARRDAIQRRIDACYESISTDKDVCGRADHPLLKAYAELGHYEHMMTFDLPLLESGIEYPIQGKFGLADTGRTTSTVHFGKGNTQNWSTSNGMRECVMPRPGKIFAIGDYSGFELRTWSQVCIWTFGTSRMAQMLNEGLDPHLEMASKILHIAYAQAREEFAADPKGRVYLARQTGKVGNFGLPGGLGAARLVEYARRNYNVIITPEEAIALKEFWLHAWPEASRYLGKAKEAMDAHQKQVRCWCSNRWRGRLTFTEYANNFFQALAADAAKHAGFLIATACYADPTNILYGSRPCMFIHDEFVLEVDDDERASDKAHELARLMEAGASFYLPDVPPVVEPVLSRRWSKSAKPVHDAHGRLVPWDLKEAA